MKNSIPSWFHLSHHEKYLQLDKNRIKWCKDLSGRREDQVKTFEIDGSLIEDIPSFYLALGESINGENGYFGTCFHSLRDCLSGGFGAKHPVTIVILNSEGIEKTRLFSHG